MRAVVVLVALVSTPFLASAAQSPTGAAQGQGHNAAHCAARTERHPDKDINKCPAPAPLPPPPPAPPACGVAASGGSSIIEGTIYNGLSWAGMGGWCVEVKGPVNASVLSDATGRYQFTNLPEGTYTICHVVQAGWRQSYPSSGPACPDGFGWSFTVVAGGRASFVSFASVPL